MTTSSAERWHEVFDLSLTLLTRTYDPSEFVVIKPHEPVNSLGTKLLEHDRGTTITFLSTPLRPFLLSVLKDYGRRDWVRKRVIGAARSATAFPALAEVDVARLTDAESIAFLWLLNCFLRDQLVSSEHGSRVLVLDGGLVADSPEEALRAIGAVSGIPLDEQTLRWMATQAPGGVYSKDPSRRYDANSRHRELSELGIRLGREADSGIEWATSHGFGEHPLY
jgi:hypothetical protein